MSLPWTPRFVFGSINLQLSLPVTRWNPGGRTVGRALHTVTGVIGASLQMRKYLLSFQLRFLETEWESVSTFISSVQSGEPFTWYPNAQDDDDSPTSYQAWLEEPMVKTPIHPTRDSAYLSLFTLPITISRMSAPWDPEYFRAIPD